jgi:hypothetical protein
MEVIVLAPYDLSKLPGKKRYLRLKLWRNCRGNISKSAIQILTSCSPNALERKKIAVPQIDLPQGNPKSGGESGQEGGEPISRP